MQALYPYSDGCMVAVMREHLKLYILEKWVHIGLIGYEVSESRVISRRCFRTLLYLQIVGIILAITLCCQLTTKTRRYAY